MTEEELRKIILKEESPKLDFKTIYEEKKENQDYIADIVSLANGNIDNIGETGYLIFGIDERNSFEHKICGANTDKKLQDIKRHIAEKLNNHITPNITNIDVKSFNIDSKRVIVIEIPFQEKVLILKKDIKNTRYKKSDFLYRIGDGIQVIKNANDSMLVKEFQEKIENFKQENNKKYQLNIEENKGKKTKNFYKIALFISIGLLISLFSYQEYSNSNTNTYLKDVDNLALVEYINDLPKEMENLDKQLQQELANNELKQELGSEIWMSDDAFYLRVLEYRTSEFTKEAYLKLAKFYKKEYFGGKSSSEFLEDYIENIRTNRQIAYKLSKLIENFVKDISDKNKKIDYSNWKSRWEKAVKMKDLKFLIELEDEY